MNILTALFRFETRAELGADVPANSISFKEVLLVYNNF